ncbi:hypothetical protein IGI04_016667 [Brassica rapa subsp. trilocularis]|uniref:Uncharacterized protein n=1 Tax=Brassica rapa subsp. trilocularis TaxID=1813537 RepID=A0ABQ7MTM0_BRACM|nr:hypothetical protein IGI04_016667 [Brassica rapa subsp. trilocularis]
MFSNQLKPSYKPRREKKTQTSISAYRYISGGMEVIKRLGSIQTDNTDRPIHEVKILRTKVID